MKAKRMISGLLAALLAAGVLAVPALAAAPDEVSSAALEQTNEMVSIRIEAGGDMVYGSPLHLEVETTPADTQYIGVLIGMSGEGKGFITLALSEKLRTLLSMIPLPRVMSATPDQTEEFNVYAYLKQLIDGNDAGILLRVADEVVSVMDVLKFYIPTLDDVANALRNSLTLIRQYVPEETGTRMYLDEQPTDSGRYVAGAVALNTGDVNTAGVATFRIKPRSEGVRLYWAQEVPDGMTAEQAQSLNAAAVAEVDGQPIPDAKIRYTYKQGGALSGMFEAGSDTFPTEPGTYTQTAELGGNYTCESISRKIKITG